MTRFRADLLLLLAAFIWGTAFIAQKTGMDSLGPFGFAGVRFLLSALVIMPFVWRENRKGCILKKKHFWSCFFMAVTFVIALLCQQIGLQTTTVTNAGFLTGLYVLGTPFAAWFLYRYKPSWIVVPACFLAVAGGWLLNGASLDGFSKGDWIVLAGAAIWSVNISLLGGLAKETKAPITLPLAQYALAALIGLGGALLWEGINLTDVQSAAFPIFYAGAISGGIAFTLQAIAQQYTPPADAAIIMAGEAPFAALSAMILLGERLDTLGWAGCALILAAILMVELRFSFKAND